MKEQKERNKIIVMAILLGICCFLTVYFHVAIKLGTVFTHFFYIPIILAALWWRRKGLLVAILLAALLILSHHSFPREFVHPYNDYLRAIMFIVVGFVVATLSELIAKAQAKVAHLNLILRSIRNVNQLIAKEKDRDRLIQGACERLVETRGYHNAWIALLDDSGGLVTTAEVGFGADFLPFVERLKRGELPACAQKALTQPGIVVTEDTLSTCADCPLAGKYGDGGAMTMRLEYGEKLYGLLSVAIPGELTADEEERALFKEVADDLAFALHSIELEEERKKAEEELKKEKKFSENIITTVPDSLIVVDKDLRIKTANLSFYKVFQLDPEKVIGCRITDIMGDEGGKLSTELNKLLGTKTSVENLELHYQSEKSGERIFSISARGLIVTEGKGEEEEVLVVIGDVTRRKKAEEALLERTGALKRSNEELERFAYVASHDLQEPLRMVSSYVQMLARRYKGKLDADADDFIAFAVGGANRMQTLINDLLTYSRVGTHGKPVEPTDCEAVLDQVLTNLKVSIEESSAVVTHDALPTVIADASQLGLLFQNLIDNAIKFRSKEYPRIHISATRGSGIGDRGSGLERRTTNHDSWVFSVRDNGIGIEPEFFERIFIIFQRLHSREEYSGTGIGLAICKKIAERHGGRIWVESKPGKGTTFFFTIPDRGSGIGDRGSKEKPRNTTLNHENQKF
ncbi:MAG: ATP-binding protein [Halobacteriota archaeon]